jgi:hypothetical protein
MQQVVNVNAELSISALGTKATDTNGGKSDVEIVKLAYCGSGH